MHPGKAGSSIKTETSIGSPVLRLRRGHKPEIVWESHSNWQNFLQSKDLPFLIERELVAATFRRFNDHVNRFPIVSERGEFCGIRKRHVICLYTH